MKRGLAPAALLALAAGAAGAALMVKARRRWRRSLETALATLEPAAVSPPAAPSDAPERQMAEWPEPLRRCLEFAGVGPATRPIRRVRLLQQGEFALRKDSWLAFTADARYAVEPPSFVWDARIRLMPFAGILVCDSYAAGRGRTAASLGGIFPLAELAGGGELAVASLQRFLAELPFLPTALAPSARLRWQALGERRLRATLSDGGIAASVDFELGDDGEIARMTALRGRETGGRLVPTPWEGRFWDYREQDGLRLPHRAEVAWILREGRMPYWRGLIVGCELQRG